MSPTRSFTLALFTCILLLGACALFAANDPFAATNAFGPNPLPEPVRVDQQMSNLDTRVLGRNTMLWRAPEALRVIVTDHATGEPVDRARVSIYIGPPSGKEGKPKRVYWGRTDRMGTIDASFRTNTANPGPHMLLIDVDSSEGTDTFAQPVTLNQQADILMTCDKPIYQPGQVIHMRALARDAASDMALAGEPVTFEVEDGRGNKVFKDHETLSEYGVASADFQLADEVNMGTFTLRVLTANDQEEKKVTVSRYVLPKFKVTVESDKTYYMPGDSVTGTVTARYIFGKPLAGAKVHLALNAADIGVSEVGHVDAVTGDDGTYKYQFALPTMLVGQPLNQGKAQVEVAAHVTDTAGQEQDGNMQVPVVASPVVVAVVPESRNLVPGIPNRVYIAAATPDGKPLTGIAVDASVNGIAADDGSLTTDPLGLTTFTFTPTQGQATVHVDANDGDGHTGSADLILLSTGSPDGLILRTDQAMAKVGDVIHLQAISTGKTGDVYIDVIRDKQTILTQSADVKDGIATLSLPITPDMEGTIEIHAYRVTPSEDIIRDTRFVIVSPADDLNVTLATDQTQYRPGQDATLNFTVRDANGAPVSTALGVAIVDESVFALSELQPGLEKIYFTLEKELMEPKYQIQGLTPSELIELPPTPVPMLRAARQTAAAMLLAGAPASDEYDYNTSTFNARYSDFVQKVIEPEMLSSYGLILDALDKYQQVTGQTLTRTDSLFTLVRAGYLNVDVLKDHWGRFYRTGDDDALSYSSWFTLSSAGVDGKWGDSDDIKGFRAWRVRQADGTYKANAVSNTVVMSRNGFDFGGGPIFFGGRAMGGVAGELRDEDAAVQLAAPLPMAAVPMPQAEAGFFADNAAGANVVNGPISSVHAAFEPQMPGSASEPPRLRQYFPETMYWNPALITDDSGLAQVTIPMADSITTWRVSTMASSAEGLLGSMSAPIKVFQDFFVDMDLPVNMTQDDWVDLPVVVYNYLPTAQDVTVTLSPGDWFTSKGNAAQKIHIAANDVQSVSFPIQVTGIGQHTLTVTALGSQLSDAVQRPITVVPNGLEVDTVINDQLGSSDTRTVTLPDIAIPGASSIWVKLYPGAFSQVVDGLDGMLRMPYGCFEQTSSTTFPNVLVLDYLKQTHKSNPEIQMKADQYINVGYQRLVTFECPGGGFSWFGNVPANQILTAYGLIEFSDMSKVHDVDPALIARTAKWLADKQQGDGSWDEPNQGIEEGITNRQTGPLRTTAYIGWALSEAGYQGGQLPSALAYVKNHWSEAKDPYTLAVVLNFLDSADPHGDTADQVAQALIGAATTDTKTASWKSAEPTFTGAVAQGADLETTGLATYALCRYGHATTFTNKALTYLVQSKDAFGTWGTTQGTVWSLKALIYAGEHSASGSSGTITINANGQPLNTFVMTPDNSDVMRQVDLGSLLKAGDNQITLSYHGDGAPLYQIVSRYYMPWADIVPAHAQPEPLSIKVAYDKTMLGVNDTAGVTVTIHNQSGAIAQMPLIDIGVPGGFDTVTDGLDQAKAAGTIDKYTVSGRQIIVYITKMDVDQVITLHYQLKAKYPIRVTTPESKAYPYYNPERVAISKPQDLVVQ